MKCYNWRKHKADVIIVEQHNHEGHEITIISGSRHDKQGKLQGYIVEITDDVGYCQTQFKHYQFREVAVSLVLTMYKLRVKEEAIKCNGCQYQDGKYCSWWKQKREGLPPCQSMSVAEGEEINPKYNKPCEHNPEIKCVQPFVNWLNPAGGCECDPCEGCINGRTKGTVWPTRK